jgi:hypothetical protein
MIPCVLPMSHPTLSVAVDGQWSRVYLNDSVR